MIKFKFHEERDIINTVESNLMDFSNPRGAIWTLALYYINLKKIDDEEAFSSIISYISNNDDTFYYEQYLSDIKKCIDKAKKYKIKNIDNIVITKTEMDKIKSFNDIKKEIDEEFKMFSDTIQSDKVNALKSIEDKKGKLKEISEIAFTEGENERKMRIEFRYNINKVMNEAIDSLNTI